MAGVGEEQRLHRLADETVDEELEQRISGGAGNSAHDVEDGVGNGRHNHDGDAAVALHQFVGADEDATALDEPTGGLDPLVQQVFRSLVREAADEGRTVFLSSHVLDEVQHTADRVAVLRAGLPLSIAGTTITRFCASGLQSIAIAAGRSSSVEPSGRPQIARTCCSNWLVTAASTVR